MITQIKDSCIACSELEHNCCNTSYDFHSYNSNKKRYILQELSTVEELLDANITSAPCLSQNEIRIQEINFYFDEIEDKVQKKVQEVDKSKVQENGNQEREERQISDEGNDEMSKLQQNNVGKTGIIKKLGAKFKIQNKLKTFYPKLKSQVIKCEKNHQNLPKNIKNENIKQVIEAFNLTVYNYLTKLSNYAPLKDKPSTFTKRQQEKKKIAFKRKAKQILDQYWKIERQN